MAIDYRSLIADRKEKQTRPIVRHEVCLIPELYAELEEAVEAQTEALAAAHDDEGNLRDARAGGGNSTPELLAAQKAVQDVEARMAEASITLVFKAPTADRQGKFADELAKRREDEPDNPTQVLIDLTRPLLVDCFDHAEGPSRERLDLNDDDAAALIDQWAFFELNQVSDKIASVVVGAPDLPFSVRQSLRNRPSAATSKRR